MIKFVRVYWKPELYEAEINRLLKEGWSLHSWQISEDKYYYAMMEKPE